MASLQVASVQVLSILSVTPASTTWTNICIFSSKSQALDIILFVIITFLQFCATFCFIFREVIYKLSEELKINDLLSFNYGSLSAGQKTKVNLCKSLVNTPKLLLLDEPTASLDPETSIFIRDYLINYQT